MTKEQKNKISELRSASSSYREIAEQLGVSVNTVKSFCSRKSKPEPETTGSDVCKNCGATIMQTSGRRRRVFCSTECRLKWWNSGENRGGHQGCVQLTCAHCGKGFSAYRCKDRKYCSRACYTKSRFGGVADD